MVWVSVVDAPVKVTVRVNVAVGEMASNSVEIASDTKVVDGPVTVERVVTVAAGTRQATVPF